MEVFGFPVARYLETATKPEAVSGIVAISLQSIVLVHEVRCAVRCSERHRP